MSLHQHIDTLVGLPNIGEEYLVRCVALRKNPFSDENGEDNQQWYPVLGKAHEDKEFLGITWHHYHYDLRFLTTKLIDNIVGQERSSWSEHKKIFSVFNYAIPEKNIIKEIQYRPMICLRKMPEFPIEILERSKTSEHGVGSTVKRLNLYNEITSFIEAPLMKVGAKMKKNKDCLRCPHRNAPLNGIPHDGKTIVCPMHGLRLDLETGAIISRREEESR